MQVVSDTCVECLDLRETVRLVRHPDMIFRESVHYPSVVETFLEMHFEGDTISQYGKQQ